MEIDPDLIREIDDPVFWAAFIHQLEDARVHLAELIADITERKQVGEVDLGVRLGHIYGHLNRAWNGRRLGDAGVSEWYTDRNCRFPDDVTIT